MRYTGRLTSWNDDRGFGFITPNGGGAKVFLHIKALQNRTLRPSEGELLTYELVFDDKSRPQAKAVRRVGEKNVTSRGGYGWLLPFLTVIFCLFLVLCVAAGRLHPKFLLLYLCMSALAFIAYAWDKAAAQEGRWRTPEQTLHLLALACGWPGALMAQRTLRHKCSKQAFLLVFRVVVVLNCACLIWLLTESGQIFLKNFPLFS